MPGEKITIDDLLKQDDVTIWELLRHNDCLDEFKFDNQKLINKICNLEGIKKLVSYSIGKHEIKDSYDELDIWRVPFYASEILCTRNNQLIEIYKTNGDEIVICLLSLIEIEITNIPEMYLFKLYN